jgi:pimeloyl-ACP methyl ester carboxylesterase
MAAAAALLPLAAGGLIAAAGFGWLQNALLYFPSRAPAAQLERGGLRAWPSVQDFRGLVAQPPGDTPARATAIVFHGNAGHAGHRAFYADALVPLGLRVILAEYPGYGPREGQPSEAALIADAAQTVALAHRTYGEPLLLIGESLGAAVAAGAAVQTGRVGALMLITPWDRLENVASHHYPLLPVRWLLHDRYDSAASLQGIGRPPRTLVVVAERDDIVPARLGTALHAGLPGQPRLTTIARAGHNDWPDRVDAAWWEDALRFLLAP